MLLHPRHLLSRLLLLLPWLLTWLLTLLRPSSCEGPSFYASHGLLLLLLLLLLHSLLKLLLLMVREENLLDHPHKLALQQDEKSKTRETIVAVAEPNTLGVRASSLWCEVEARVRA